MRTKKILSVLLAIFMFATIGVMSVSAEENGEVSASAAARTGWPSEVLLSDEAASAGGWHQGLIQWTPFTAGSDGTSTLKNGFSDFYAEQKVTYTWEGYSYQYVTDDEGNVVRDASGAPMKGPKIPLVIEKNEQEAARNYLATYAEYTGSKVNLVIKQGTIEDFVGEVTAWLTVIAPDAPVGTLGKDVTVTSLPQTIYLRDSEDFSDKIDEAQKILDKSSRYKEAFIKKLQIEVNIANMYLRAYPADSSRINATLEMLDQLIKEAPANVQLTSVEWLDFLNNVPNGLINAYWKLADFFSFIGKFFTATGPAFKAFFNMVGSLLKGFSLLTPIFSLITGLFS